MKLWYQLYQHHHGFLITFLLYFDKEGEGKVKGAKRCELCHQWALSVQWGTICGATINFNGTNHSEHNETYCLVFFWRLLICKNVSFACLNLNVYYTCLYII